MTDSPVARIDGGNSSMKESLFENPEFLAIAQRHGKSMAQVLLRWQVQRGVVGPGCAGAVNRH